MDGTYYIDVVGCMKDGLCKIYISQHIQLQRHTGYTERSGNTFIPLCTLFCGLFASEQDAGNDRHTCSYCRGRTKNDGKLNRWNGMASETNTMTGNCVQQLSELKFRCQDKVKDLYTMEKNHEMMK